MAREITTDLLRELLLYDPETGLFWWKERREEMFTPNHLQTSAHRSRLWNSQYAGKPALTALQSGYRVGAVWGRNLLAHRAAWAISHGEMPNIIDHVNGNRSDNRIVNIRSVDFTDNARNCRISKNNTSGVNGVSLDKKSNRWVASVMIDRKNHYLGAFLTLDEAAASRKAAERGHFHPNHGRAG